MTPVSFDKICRFCLTSNGARAIYMLNGNVDKFKQQTEYEIAQLLEKWMGDDKKKCEFCGSPYVEGVRIEIGNYKLYDFDRIVSECREKNGELFIWTVVKKGQNIEIKIAGKNTHDPLFIRECFTKLFEILDSYPEEKMIHNPQMGDLFVCFTGEYDYENQSFNPVVQRLWSTGMAHHEVIRCMNAQLKNFEMEDLVRSE